MGARGDWPAVICGLEQEAEIARHYLLNVAVTGGQAERAFTLSRLMLDQGAAGLVSFGIAGALNPDLRPGDLVIGLAVSDGGQAYAVPSGVVERLRRTLPDAHFGLILGSDHVLLTAAQKRIAFDHHAALCVDMESQAVAKVACGRDRPFAVIRAIADRADQTLPDLVASALDADGRPKVAHTLAAIARAPWQVAGLLRAWSATARALDGLFRRGSLGLVSLG